MTHPARSKVDGVDDIEHEPTTREWIEGLIGTTPEAESIIAALAAAENEAEAARDLRRQLKGAVSELRQAHERLTRDGVPTHDDHGKPLGLTLRIAVALDTAGGR